MRGARLNLNGSSSFSSTVAEQYELRMIFIHSSKWPPVFRWIAQRFQRCFSMPTVVFFFSAVIFISAILPFGMKVPGTLVETDASDTVERNRSGRMCIYCLEMMSRVSDWSA